MGIGLLLLMNTILTVSNSVFITSKEETKHLFIIVSLCILDTGSHYVT